MTGEIVSLNRARKAKARAEKTKRAEANRAAHGRTKTEKTRAKDVAERAARTLDAKKIDKDLPDGA